MKPRPSKGTESSDAPDNLPTAPGGRALERLHQFEIARGLEPTEIEPVEPDSSFEPGPLDEDEAECDDDESPTGG